ncbi:MAG TPA: acyl-CoA dehydrogenase family protein [Candidatus Entotheonella sp.]|jgi:alkylation response protein AidB-like acyl-CoA dehydrogenase
MLDIETQSPLTLARELAPQIRSCADEIEAERELPRALFETLADAGFFHLALPRSLGCPEIDLPTYIQVIEELGKADASTAWVINQGAIFATYAARMPHDVARSIWIDTPRGVVSNTPAAIAEAIVVPGGFRVTGELGFSTGCRHASWVAPHAQIIENGAPRLLDDGQPETRYLFVPVDEAELLDTWHVRGLRGTGTHHFAVHDVFVPEARSILSATAPLIETGPLYQLPRTLVFASGDAAVSLGLAQSCFSAFIELAGHKAPRAVQGLLRDQPMVQADVGHAEAQLRAARALLRETVRETWDEVSTTGSASLDQRAALRIATTHAIRLSIEVIDILYNAGGATSVYDGHFLQRAFQDIHVISQHMQSRRAHYELIGRYWLGLPTDGGRF